MRLTGARVTDFASASLCAPLYDARRRVWSRDVLARLDIAAGLLPELRPAHDVAGRVTVGAARETGLREGTPVVVGGADFAASALAAGVTEPGEAALMLGTAGNLILPFTHGDFDTRFINSLGLMGRVAILGAGFMGSALTVPASENGHIVSLWGTHLDGHLIAAVRDGRPHPKLGMALPASVKTFTVDELSAALEGADLVINAVTSDGAVPVLTRAAPFIRSRVPVLTVSKGLAEHRGRAVDSLHRHQGRRAAQARHGGRPFQGARAGPAGTHGCHLRID